MDLEEFKSQVIKEKLNIDEGIFGHVLCMIDFGNVDHWFEEDRMNFNGSSLNENEKFVIDFRMLFDVLNCISMKSRFYFGHDPNKKNHLDLLPPQKEFLAIGM